MTLMKANQPETAVCHLPGLLCAHLISCSTHQLFYQFLLSLPSFSSLYFLCIFSSASLRPSLCGWLSGNCQDSGLWYEDHHMGGWVLQDAWVYHRVLWVTCSIYMYVIGLSPTQGSQFFLEKWLPCPARLALPCLSHHLLARGASPLSHSNGHFYFLPHIHVL